jgi:amino acid transporter
LTHLTKAVPRIKVLSLIAATYFIVSGGPYGLEELISKNGFDRSLLLLILTPILWSLPTALMVGELSSALPEEGGYYVWVRRALGRFWGFQEAWLSLVASVFDMAIYPTLFALYLGRLFPVLGQGVGAVAVGIGMIAACTAWNLRGASQVGKGSFLLGGLLLAPFALLAGASLFHLAPHTTSTNAPGLWAGIFIAMWNYMGWDNASTFAGEVDRPQRTYPLAMMATVGLICVTYLVPVLASRHAGLDPSAWSTGSWVAAGTAVAGPWLGLALVLGGMISSFGSFNALVLSYSRIPVVLAEDGYLPAAFSKRLQSTGAPVVSILVCAAAYACCLGLGFQRLVQMDIVLYGLSLVLEFAALVVLRIREPNLLRPFRIPGGVPAAVLLGIAPTALLVAAMVAGLDDPGGLRGLLSAAFLAGIGPAACWLLPAEEITTPERA